MAPGEIPTTLYAFQNGNDGAFPQITPTLGAPGSLWGAVARGSGAIWKLTGKALKIERSFTGDIDGFEPNGPLQLAGDGNLYSTTSGGGSM